MIESSLPLFNNPLVHKEALDSHAIVSVTDKKGIIVYANELFCETSGYTQSDLIGSKHNIVNSRHHPSVFFRNMWKTVVSGRTWSGEIKNKRKDGSFYWVKSTIFPILNKDNKPESFLAVRTDITLQKEAEIQAKEESIRKTKFLSSISHELRTPLNAIKGFSQLLSKENFDETTNDYIGLILDSAESLERQISSLLTYNSYRERNLEVETVGLEPIFSHIKETFSTDLEKKKITLNIQIASNVAVETDRSYLIMILENLVANSIKYTPENGKILLSTQLDSKNIIISVLDSGIGIPEGAENIIYNRFERLEQAGSNIEGVGLGLCLVKELTETIHGQIDYNSTLNIGTEFKLTLPKKIQDNNLVSKN